MSRLLTRFISVSLLVSQIHAAIVTQIVQVIENVLAEKATTPTTKADKFETVFLTVTATKSISKDELTNAGKTATTSFDSVSYPTDTNIENYNGLYSLNKTFAQIMLNEHNVKRQLHKAQSLHWNSSAFDYASAYASKYDCTGTLTHSGGSTFGENLAIGYSPTGAIDAWYNEGDSYSYGTESTYNHFTAVVWNDTFSVGCAYKYCNAVWGTYIICSYYPPGNIVGHSTKNVFQLS